MTYDNAKKYALQFVETLFENWNIPNNPEDFIKVDHSDMILIVFEKDNIKFNIMLVPHDNQLVFQMLENNSIKKLFVDTIKWRSWYKALQYMFLYEFMKDQVDPEKNRLKKPD